eukprot:233133-Chlamydomonas_euryale.AAC.1
MPSRVRGGAASAVSPAANEADVRTAPRAARRILRQLSHARRKRTHAPSCCQDATCKGQVRPCGSPTAAAVLRTGLPSCLPYRHAVSRLRC